MVSCGKKPLCVKILSSGLYRLKGDEMIETYVMAKTPAANKKETTTNE
jgi:hypothetical protein